MSNARFRKLPSPAFILACIALFAAIGGVGYAAGKLKKDSVGAKQIKSNAVRSAEIKDGAVKSADLAPDAVSVPPGPAGFGVFNDDPVNFPTNVGAGREIATLSNLPAGTYAITAKAVASISGTPDRGLTCKLSAPPDGSGDFDTTEFHPPAGGVGAMPMQVLHEFPEDGGQVQIKCTMNFIGGSGSVSVDDAKIQAIRLSSATNDPVSG
jgi:hypothetical protein